MRQRQACICKKNICVDTCCAGNYPTHLTSRHDGKFRGVVELPCQIGNPLDFLHKAREKAGKAGASEVHPGTVAEKRLKCPEMNGETYCIFSLM
jgi:hypothetical protein